MRILVAIGGNAIEGRVDEGIEARIEILGRAMRPLVSLVREGHHLVLTHGNGPQVGRALARVEEARDALGDEPLYMCGAEVQGRLGFLMAEALTNQLRAGAVGREVVAILTRVLVSRDDPAFAHPTKPIGRFLDPEEAERLVREKGIQVVEDAGRGFRRVVPSPLPLEILEVETVEILSDAGLVVVCCGGGGIPVIRREDGTYSGVDAVIDKDRSSALLARNLDADLLILTTAVDEVRLDHGKPTERALSTLTLQEARQHLAAGQFPAGSMGPKIESAIEFVAAGRGEAIITSPERIPEALAGTRGTRVTR